MRAKLVSSHPFAMIVLFVIKINRRSLISNEIDKIYQWSNSLNSGSIEVKSYLSKANVKKKNVRILKSGLNWQSTIYQLLFF